MMFYEKKNNKILKTRKNWSIFTIRSIQRIAKELYLRNRVTTSKAKEIFRVCYNKKMMENDEYEIIGIDCLWLKIVQLESKKNMKKW